MSTVFQRPTINLSEIRQREEIKSMWIEKKENNYLCRWHVHPYGKSTRINKSKLLEQRDYGSLSGYSITFQYCNSLYEEFETENTLPFILALPKMHYLTIKLATCNYCLCKENYKTLMGIASKN